MQRTYEGWRAAARTFTSPLSDDDRASVCELLSRMEAVQIDQTVLKIEQCDWPDHPEDVGCQYFGQNQERLQIDDANDMKSLDHPGPVPDSEAVAKLVAWAEQQQTWPSKAE